MTRLVPAWPTAVTRRGRGRRRVASDLLTPAPPAVPADARGRPAAAAIPGGAGRTASSARPDPTTPAIEGDAQARRGTSTVRGTRLDPTPTAISARWACRATSTAPADPRGRLAETTVAYRTGGDPTTTAIADRAGARQCTSAARGARCNPTATTIAPDAGAEPTTIAIAGTCRARHHAVAVARRDRTRTDIQGGAGPRRAGEAGGSGVTGARTTPGAPVDHRFAAILRGTGRTRIARSIGITEIPAGIDGRGPPAGVGRWRRGLSHP
jgi:hypothetical protein